MKGVLIFTDGVISYAIGMATLAYMAGFLGNIVTPKSIDSGPEGPLGQALLINVALLALFGLQHTVMARPGFKRAGLRLLVKPWKGALMSYS